MPLVSCIMPTADRRRFVPQAIRYFLRQDYPEKELIIIDDGQDCVRDLIPEDARIRYVRLERRLTVGAKRNLACEQARGAFIAHWDDDDWHATHRLSYQVGAMLDSQADVCGINKLLFYDAEGGHAWEYVYPSSQKLWLSGSTLCYTRAFWQTNKFEEINVGEDGRFVWSERQKRMHVLTDSTFHVGLVHEHNVSPKRTTGSYWRTIPVERIRHLIGADLAFYHAEAAPTEAATVTDTATEEAATRTVASRSLLECAATTISVEERAPLAGESLMQPAQLRNVYACLVHEKPECVIDLVRNLHYLDPSSVIILYNGGEDTSLLRRGFPFEQYGAHVHPRPRPMRWGWLHDFALDCMQYALEHFAFDTMTIVDSDQMGVRANYTRYLTAHLRHRPHVGLLGNAPDVQPRHTRIPPAVQALKEFDLWRPFLRRFERGEEKFVHWTFWPSTIFTRDAASDLVKLFRDDEQLQDIMARSQIWATEEIIFPTLVALLGYELMANPCSYDYVRYRVRYTLPQLDGAFMRPDLFWMHPVPRQYDDPLRKHIRARFKHYERPTPAPATAAAAPVATSRAPVTTITSLAHVPAPDEAATPFLLPTQIISQMKRIEGWLDDTEADLMIAALSRVLKTLPAPHHIVEVGSYCGRATFVLGTVARTLAPAARIYSIDEHDGRVGALDQGVRVFPPTLEKFRRNMQQAGLGQMVEIIQRRSREVRWDVPVSFLLIDGFHDYASVAEDFYHFERWLVPNAYVAFHDYASYFPGVQTFVNELLSTGHYRKVHCEKSLMVMQRVSSAPRTVDAPAIEAIPSHERGGQTLPPSHTPNTIRF